jgi:hypothetical protein
MWYHIINCLYINERNFMTSPALAISTPLGRLYRKPETPLSTVQDIQQALSDGLLMPSVTNVIDALNKPFLNNWYAKRAAEDAVEVVSNHPGLIQQKPQEAIKWISGAARRSASSAANLGDAVHNYVEALSLQDTPEDPEDPRVLKFADQWHQFVEQMKPKFIHAEATIFGTTYNFERAYAGTADFIAEIDGQLYVGDYKTGRSVHAEAALQLSALRHGKEIVIDGATEELPEIAGEIVVHLQENSFTIYKTNESDRAWEHFSVLREAWSVQKDMQVPSGTWGFEVL